MRVGKYFISESDILNKYDLPCDAKILDIRKINGEFAIIIEHNGLENVKSIKEAQIIPNKNLPVT